ncbi:hypothetical protein CDAR_520001 [Caerostris darwini]|uniref:Uncharacterized protein n=1 Tax=Caerostris darwini TaxID=1538125 RepID=A0AAV4WV05_9ARAC|nr:hypothetical protein CDAR_520001 [Caerostris darwini]
MGIVKIPIRCAAVSYPNRAQRNIFINSIHKQSNPITGRAPCNFFRERPVCVPELSCLQKNKIKKESMRGPIRNPVTVITSPALKEQEREEKRRNSELRMQIGKGREKNTFRIFTSRGRSSEN